MGRLLRHETSIKPAMCLYLDSEMSLSQTVIEVRAPRGILNSHLNEISVLTKPHDHRGLRRASQGRAGETGTEPVPFLIQNY